MCGEIPKGHYGKDVVLHFETNNNFARLDFPYTFEHITEIRINEITIVDPNAGLAVPNLWRIEFTPLMETVQVCTAGGAGYAFNINSATISHVSYDRPRVVSVNNRAQMSSISGRLVTVSPVGVVGDPVFTDATFNLTFIMKNPTWVPEKIMALDKTEPLYNRGINSTRARFEVPDRRFK